MLVDTKSRSNWNVGPLLKEFRHNPILWLLSLVPVALIAAKLVPAAHTLLFVLSVLAIVPLAALLSRATESVAEKTGDAVGGLLNATLGNLSELVIATAALRAGEYALVKGSIAGAIVTNTLFMLGASFLLGGLKPRLSRTADGWVRFGPAVFAQNAPRDFCWLRTRRAERTCLAIGIGIGHAGRGHGGRGAGKRDIR